MASLSAARPANLMLGFSSRPLVPSINAIKLCTRASPAFSSLRFERATRSQKSQRQVKVCAMNSGSSNGKTPNKEAGLSENTSKGGGGPPLLTVLAGAFVFFFFCWLIGSILMWLISLIVKAPSPK